MTDVAHPAPGALPLAPGDRVGKYRLRRLVGDGGMGLVFEAEHDTLDELFALKILKPHTLTSADAVRRFIVEARASARIRSAHVVRVTDVGTDERLGTPYMVMELLEGQDLADLLAARGKLPIASAVDYVLEALEAIAEAHSLGIVHRDLKPSNLFLARGQEGQETIKVLDFGISKANESISRQASGATATNQLLGTPAYMSPEQLRSAKHVDPRTDIWAIGVLFFELVTGHPPFNANTIGELFASIFEDDPPVLRGHLPEAPETLERVVSRCLERKLERRFSDVEELASALAPFGTPGTARSLERIRRVLGKSGTPSSPLLPAHAPASGPVAASPETVALAKTASMTASMPLAVAAAAAARAADVPDVRPRPVSVSALVSPAPPLPAGPRAGSQALRAAWIGVAVAAIAAVIGIALIRASGNARRAASSSSSEPTSVAPIATPSEMPAAMPSASPTETPSATATASATASASESAGPSAKADSRPPTRPTASPRPTARPSTTPATPSAPALLQHDRN